MNGETFWRYFPLVLFLAMGLVGEIIIGSIFWSGLKALREAISARSWEKTDGAVTASETRPISGTDDFALLVSYEYTVNGQTFKNDRIAFWETRAASRASLEEQRMAQYTPGKAVVVYYNPSNPIAAALTPPQSGGFLGTALLVQGIVTVIGCAIAMFALAYGLSGVVKSLFTGGWPE